MAAAAEQVSVLFTRISDGDAKAADELLPLVYQELRRLAGARMAREKPGQTLQATALVHEAYLRLVGDWDPGWENRGHFFGAAAEAMRRILIERARRVRRIRHGGDQMRVTFAESIQGADHDLDELLDIDAALSQLETKDPMMARVVKLRFFAGLSIDETAGALDISKRSVNRYWTAARAWLRVAMAEQKTRPPMESE